MFLLSQMVELMVAYITDRKCVCICVLTRLAQIITATHSDSCNPASKDLLIHSDHTKN